MNKIMRKKLKSSIRDLIKIGHILIKYPKEYKKVNKPQLTSLGKYTVKNVGINMSSDVETIIRTVSNMTVKKLQNKTGAELLQIATKNFNEQIADDFRKIDNDSVTFTMDVGNPDFYDDTYYIEDMGLDIIKTIKDLYNSVYGTYRF